MKTWKTLALALVALIIAACGSGSESSSSDTAAATDTAALEILSVDEAKTVALISPAEIDATIAGLTNGQPVVTKTRSMVAGEMQETAQAPVLQRIGGEYQPETNSLMLQSQLDGKLVTEDIRVFEHEGQLYLVDDIYDGESPNLSIGRSTPVEIDAPKSVAKKAQAPAPKISSVGGATDNSAGITKGLVDMSCGNRYNGGRVVDDGGEYHWTISGSNFGTSGSVTLAGKNVKVVRWSSGSIEIAPTVSSTAGPMCTTLSVATASGSASVGINLVPSIKTRIYGQCTYWVALNRIKMGKQPSPSAYGGYASMTGSYVPKAGDQLQFSHSSSKHAAIITDVCGPVSSNGGKKWTIIVSEMNYDCKNSTRSYSTTFETSKNGQVLQYPKSSISGYSDCRLYYR